jgi:hypothetical protein
VRRRSVAERFAEEGGERHRVLDNGVHPLSPAGLCRLLQPGSGGVIGE